MTMMKYSLLIVPLGLAISTSGCSANVGPEGSEGNETLAGENVDSVQEAIGETACAFGTFDFNMSTVGTGATQSANVNPPYGDPNGCKEAIRVAVSVAGASGGSMTVRYNGTLPTTQAACNAISVTGQLWETDPHTPNTHTLRKGVFGNGVFVSGKCSVLQRSTGVFPLNNGNDWRWVAQAKSGSGALQPMVIKLAAALQ